MFNIAHKWGALLAAGTMATIVVAAAAPAGAATGVGCGDGYPIINQNGVVNGSDFRADDIHVNTVVSVFGQQFFPTDQVLVYDYADNGQFVSASITVGSPWWYDSCDQINATLPNLPPGTAYVAVLSGIDFESNFVQITILP